MRIRFYHCWHLLFLKFFIFFLAIAIFIPGLNGGFIFDDTPNIVKNTALHITNPGIQDLLYAAYSFQPGHGSRPLPMLSFAIDHWFSGLNAAAFKTTNLIIHGLTTLALMTFFRMLLTLSRYSYRQATAGAILLSLAWALHPLQVSSVLYVVQRMQTLGTLFLVLALLAYLNARNAQMESRRSRQYMGLTLLFGVLALACKEDSVLLPIYMLSLELTVLRFQAKNPTYATLLKKIYAIFVSIGLMVFLIAIVPRHWHWDAYPGRNFSTPERLLTQGRVLLMYLQQIILPLPDSMPFYYDDFTISRNFFDPWTTTPAWSILALLFITAWALRSIRPLFSLGIFLFFAGHFISSNVISLELAFEHRNHLPIAGILLAMFDIFIYFWKRWAIRAQWVIIISAIGLIALASGTAVRAHAWGEPLRFAKKSVKIAPHSARAWLILCTSYFDRSNSDRGSPYLDMAISTCKAGADMTGSPSLLSNVVIFKTLKGNVTQKDWEAFLQGLQDTPMSPQNKDIIWIILDNIDRGIPLDEYGILRTIEITTSRAKFKPQDYIRLGAYIFNETHQPQKAYNYLQQAVELSEPGDISVEKMLSELRDAGREDWARNLTAGQKENP